MAMYGGGVTSQLHLSYKKLGKLGFVMDFLTLVATLWLFLHSEHTVFFAMS